MQIQRIIDPVQPDHLADGRSVAFHSTITDTGGATAPARAEAAPDALQLRSWAAACFNCHGPGGHAEKGNESLAGKDAEEMFRKLMDYKSGRKPATLMHQLSKGYTDEQLKAIVGWFAAQKP